MVAPTNGEFKPLKIEVTPPDTPSTISTSSASTPTTSGSSSTPINMAPTSMSKGHRVKPQTKQQQQFDALRAIFYKERGKDSSVKDKDIERDFLRLKIDFQKTNPTSKYNIPEYRRKVEAYIREKSLKVTVPGTPSTGSAASASPTPKAPQLAKSASAPELQSSETDLKSALQAIKQETPKTPPISRSSISKSALDAIGENALLTNPQQLDVQPQSASRSPSPSTPSSTSSSEIQTPVESRPATPMFSLTAGGGVSQDETTIREWAEKKLIWEENKGQFKSESDFEQEYPKLLKGKKKSMAEIAKWKSQVNSYVKENFDKLNENLTSIKENRYPFDEATTQQPIKKEETAKLEEAPKQTAAQPEAPIVESRQPESAATPIPTVEEPSQKEELLSEAEKTASDKINTYLAAVETELNKMSTGINNLIEMGKYHQHDYSSLIRSVEYQLKTWDDDLMENGVNIMNSVHDLIDDISSEKTNKALIEKHTALYDKFYKVEKQVEELRKVQAKLHNLQNK